MPEPLDDGHLAGRLRRLDAATPDPVPDFDYPGLLERHSVALTRARRRTVLARSTAAALVVVMTAVSVWRLDRVPVQTAPAAHELVTESAPEPRLVRADTYLALATLEDHIATLDDALSEARLIAPQGNEVARLERARAELLDSYVRVRYADRVAANF